MPTPNGLNRPIVGTKMRAALSEIERTPGLPHEVAERMFGKATITRLLTADLAESRGKHLTGRKLYVLKKAGTGDFTTPVPGFTFTGPKPGKTRAEVIAHNNLAVRCPGCKAAAGHRCRSKKNGQEVRFPHYERIDEALYTMAILLHIDRPQPHTSISELDQGFPA